MQAPVTVRLWIGEIRRCDFVGFCRDMRAKEDGKLPANGFVGDTLQIHQFGCYGENAFCKSIGVHWPGSVDTYKGPDLDKDVQIRTRSKSWYDLLVRPDAKPHHRYVHVTGALPYFTIQGWMFAYEAMKSHYIQTYGNRPRAYFVPTEFLDKDFSGFLPK